MLWCVVFFFFKQRTAYEMRISDWSSDVCSSDLLAALLLVALQQFARVGQHIGGEQIRSMELPQRRDHIVLRRRILTQFLDQPFPQLFDRALTVETADKAVGAFLQAMRLPGGPIVQNILHHAAIAVTRDADMGLQPRAEPGDLEP